MLSLSHIHLPALLIPSKFPALMLQSLFHFTANPDLNERISLRWLHVLAGIVWIGLLYFFNFIGIPFFGQLDGPTRIKIYPAFMSRAMSWFRWSALVTVLVGLRYYWILLQADATSAGEPWLLWRWLWVWFAVWIVAYAFLYVLQMPVQGILDNGWLRAIPMIVVIVTASGIDLRLNDADASSSPHLAISIGGGLGLLMLLNVWGIVWRAQKRLIQFAKANVESGIPLPEEVSRLMRWSFIASRTGLWLSFPMLFFMVASEHYPFLGR